MNIITYNGTDYPTRTFDAYLSDENEDGIQTITIASSLLGEALGMDNYSDDLDEEVLNIDDQIYYYVDAEYFDLPAEEICKLYLDEPFVFVTEYED